jgi:condensation domain-containing protein
VPFEGHPDDAILTKDAVLLTGLGIVSNTMELITDNPSAPISCRQVLRILRLAHGTQYAESGKLTSTEVMSLAVQIKGNLDSSALESAFSDIIQTHPALNVIFGIVQDQPFVARYDGKPVFEYSDLSGNHTFQAQALAMTMLRTWANEPFNLAASPPVRAGLLRISPTEHVFRIEFDHIASDQRSVEIILEQISANYRIKISTAICPSRNIISVEWPKYVERQREAIESSRLDGAIEAWTKLLRPGEAIPRLPFGSAGTPAPKSERAPAATASRPLSIPVTRGLRQYSRSLGITPFVLVLSVTHHALALMGKVHRTGLLTSTSHRGIEFDQTVGLFSNPLPVFVDHKNNTQLGELIRCTAQTFHDIILQAWVPYPVLIYHFNAHDPICMPTLPRLSLTVESKVSRREHFDLEGTVTRTNAVCPDGIFPGCLFFTVNLSTSCPWIQAFYDESSFTQYEISDFLAAFTEVATIIAEAVRS